MEKNSNTRQETRNMEKNKTMSHVACRMSRRRAFTLVELAIVVALIATVSFVTVMSLIGRKQSKDLQTVQEGVVAVLREAQSRSITQDQNTSWGVHFSNPTGTSAFYALFYTSYSTGTVVSQYTLPSDVIFSSSSVTSGGSLDIIFSQITGLPSTSTSITLDLVSGGGTLSGSSASLNRQSSGKVFFDNFGRSSL